MRVSGTPRSQTLLKIRFGRHEVGETLITTAAAVCSTVVPACILHSARSHCYSRENKLLAKGLRILPNSDKVGSGSCAMLLLTTSTSPELRLSTPKTACHTCFSGRRYSPTHPTTRMADSKKRYYSLRRVSLRH